MNRIRFVAAVCLLVGCVSQRSPEIPVNLGHVDNWSLSGKLGVRSEAGGANLGFSWRQVQDTFVIEFTGPLGAQVASIEGAIDDARLYIDDREDVVQGSVSQILYSQLGFFVPVGHLADWVRGIPSPSFAHAKTEDGFIQAGWQVSYQDYSESGPRKMTAQRDDLRLRLVSMRWQY